MQYNVAGLLKAPTGEMREVELDEALVLDEPDIRLVAPITGRLRLIRDHAGVLVEGRLETRAALECARCLAPVAVDVAFELSEAFRPTVVLPGGPTPPPPEDLDPATQIDALHVLDLTEVVRQAVLLALPVHPLCRQACAGLCPRCGSDLNERPCDCPAETDARWAALRAMLETDGEEHGAEDSAPEMGPST